MNTMMNFEITTRTRSRKAMRSALFCFLLGMDSSLAFLPSPPSTSVKSSNVGFPTTCAHNLELPRTTSTSLNVWWFGGTENTEPSGNDESCELVAVRIEKTSANSRRIAGEISVPATIDEVWSILTDYDRLSIHVPNLMESKILQRQSQGRNGDGTFQCRLFQKGAQKIIGFDFSASVTMDMTEQILTAADKVSKTGSPLPQGRKIGFKCVDSQFFSNFDGDWVVKEQIGPNGEVETVCAYSVDVRPKGPVPVAALEWRIREDVPTNLRAVKAAAILLSNPKSINTPALAKAYAEKNGALLVSSMMDWDRDETMAKYL
jgi:hypothetical protein